MEVLWLPPATKRRLLIGELATLNYECERELLFVLDVRWRLIQVVLCLLPGCS